MTLLRVSALAQILGVIAIFILLIFVATELVKNLDQRRVSNALNHSIDL